MEFIQSVRKRYKPKLVKYVKLDKRYSKSKNKNSYNLEFKKSQEKER